MIKSNFPFLKFIYVKTFPQHGKLPWGDISFHSLTAWSFNGGGKKNKRQLRAASQTVDKLDENRVCLHFFWLVQIWTLISTSGTRFPRAVREPPRRYCACGVSLRLAIPAGVSHLPFQSTMFKILDGNSFCLQSFLF